jgi:alanyl-tRNA synthetase
VLDRFAPMTHSSSEIRAAFLDFFRTRGHEVCKSAPLVPENDPTLMFTNAGMVQFKDVFTGKETRPFKRATSSQKCIRISGKHNDLENVGVTARHHTFFEMLGNFSFGDYFKEDAIVFAWELLTKVYAVPTERLVVTVFGGEGGFAPDDEARATWKKVTGFPDERIIGLGLKDNFWQMGDTGPCGPCTEIHFFHGDTVDLASFGDEPSADGRGWMEIWNLVFMQYERFKVDGASPASPEHGQHLGAGEIQQKELPKPSVDTGMGLERISSVLQGKSSNYETDLLRALVDKAAEIAGKPYHGSLGDDDVSMRVIADHARTTAFLIAEGVFPDRGAREYVLRRVMRRAVRHGERLGIKRPFFHEVTELVTELMGDAYGELRAKQGLIKSITLQEEERFRETLERGLKLLEEEIATVKTQGGKEIPGAAAFKLYDTYGFPLDLTEVIAQERGVTIDRPGYDKALEEQKARSEGSKVGEAAVEDVWHTAMVAIAPKLPQGVRFTGYDAEEGTATILAIAKGATLVDRALLGDEVGIVTDATPFYGEAGGQVGDRGTATAGGGKLEVTDAQKPVTGLIVHLGKVTEGSLAVGDKVKLAVDHGRRSATRRNHSATHLLHWALRTVLGEQAAQKGSLVGPDRLRFDFSHGKAVSPEEIVAIEDLVNAKILTNAPVQTQVLPIEEAKKTGAMAIFEEKYGDVVRVLTMTSDSVELCGGTHARALGDIGLFKIMSEGGVAAGVRRIEAATGTNALAYVRKLEGTVKAAARVAKSGAGDLPEKIEKLVEQTRALEKELAETRKKLAMGEGSGGGGADEMLRGARDVPGGKALAVKVDAADPATLRQMAEQLRDKLGDAVVLVASAGAGKAQLVVTVSKSLLDRYKAGEVIKQVALVVGGSGGGRPDMAQAGGTQVDKIDEALSRFYAVVS